MRTVAVVQARTGSTRFPGKVLAELAGEPMILHVLRRLTRSQALDDVVLATTDHSADDDLVRAAEQAGVRWFRGSERDVLGRVTGAAADSKADAIVRVTGDCPLIAPDVVDAVASALLTRQQTCDYASNVIRRTFPRGLDCEALFFDVLRRVDRQAISAAAREHVTWYVYRERPDLFLIHSVEGPADYSRLDWSVDTAQDLERVASLLGDSGSASTPEPWLTLAQLDLARAEGRG